MGISRIFKLLKDFWFNLRVQNSAIYIGGFYYSIASHGQTFRSPPAKPGVYLLEITIVYQILCQ